MMDSQPDSGSRFDHHLRLPDLIIGIKGAGEMASGVAASLYKSNLCKILMLEVEFPLAVRRKVSFCEAIHSGRCRIEGIEAMVARNKAEIYAVWENRAIAVIQDPEWKILPQFGPDVVIDATLAKINLGTSKTEAPLVIGMGPGFQAGNDVHMVIETQRGHDLGRILRHGSALPNTGVPGNIGGYTHQRVLRAPCDGIFETDLDIGVSVKENQTIGRVGERAVKAQISGVLRGLIHPGTRVKKGLKIGDIDPRGNVEYCHTVSDKASALGGSVLQAILSKFNNPGPGSKDLAGAIGLTGNGLVSLIGAGGKTSLMFKLANELVRAGKSVLTTTTTKIFLPEKAQSPHTIAASSVDDLLAKITAAAQTMPHFSAGANIEQNSGKLIGIPPEVVDLIWRTGLFDVVIVEADGAKQLPLKASAGHEPAIPSDTSHLVYVAGLDAIGKRVERVVHRHDIFMAHLALEPKTMVTENHMADSISLEIKKAAKLCRSLINSIILNKADDAEKKNQGVMIAHRLKGNPSIHQIAVLALNTEKPVKHFTRTPTLGSH